MWLLAHCPRNKGSDPPFSSAQPGAADPNFTFLLVALEPSAAHLGILG